MLQWIKSLFVREKSQTPEVKDHGERNVPKSFHVDRMGVESKEKKELPDFSLMTKLDIDIWGRDELGLKLDRRRTKQHMIQTIRDHLDEGD
jgi:hypothetical protein